MQVASVNCHVDPEVCRELKPESHITFYEVDTFPSNISYPITSSSLKEITTQVLSLLPDLSLITEESFYVSIHFLSLYSIYTRMNLVEIKKSSHKEHCGEAMAHSSCR